MQEKNFFTLWIFAGFSIVSISTAVILLPALFMPGLAPYIFGYWLTIFFAHGLLIQAYMVIISFASIVYFLPSRFRIWFVMLLPLTLAVFFHLKFGNSHARTDSSLPGALINGSNVLVLVYGYWTAFWMVILLRIGKKRGSIIPDRQLT
ncbi:MAG: hypothetical protein FJX23_03590 [Alphaproteobacteria bacterium]|nr:hypothetical protein [Alphaproteobacteria bacterium]